MLGSERPCLLTPTKKAALVKANMADQRETVRHIHRKVKDSGMGVSHASVFVWLKTTGAVSRRRCIKPSLASYQIWNRLLIVVNQVDTMMMSFSSAFNVIHVDQTWFCLMVDGERARYFPEHVLEGAQPPNTKATFPK